MLEQVRRVRSNKIHAGLQLLVGPITVKLNNLSAMEVNTIRPFFQGSLDRFYSLAQVIDAEVFDVLPRCCARLGGMITGCSAAQMDESLSSDISTQSTLDSQTQPPASQAPRQLRRAAP